MSAENVECHRQFAVVAFNARDIEAMLAYCDPGIEFHGSLSAVGRDVYHGHEGMRRWHKDREETWGAGLRGDPEAFFDLGDRTLAFAVLRGRGRQSGVEVAMSVAQVVTWRNGLGVLAKIYPDRDDALRDLGLSLDELEPIAP